MEAKGFGARGRWWVAGIVLIGVACIDPPRYPACKDDRHCRHEAGEVCVDGACQNCVTDADCQDHPDPNARTCVEYRCGKPVAHSDGPVTGGPCTGVTDCPVDHTCNAGRCDPVAAEQGGFAVVGGGARIYLGPTLDADYVTLDRERIRQRLVAVSDAEGPMLRLEISSAAEDAKNCVKEITWQPLRLQAWIRPSDLLPVLTREVDIEFDDGTAARLRPGLMVEPAHAPGEYLVSGRGVKVTLPLPADAVGHRFSPSPPFDGAGATGTVPAGQRLMLDRSREFDARGDWLYKVLEEGPAGEDRGDRRGGPLPIADFGAPQGLHRVRMRCADFTVAVLDESAPPHRRGPLPKDIPPFLGRAELEAKRVPGGVSVTWLDGTPAGTILGDGTNTHGVMVDGAWCFEVLSFTRPRLGACVAASDLAGVNAEPAP